MDVKDTKISLKMKNKNYFIIEEDHTKNQKIKIDLFCIIKKAKKQKKTVFV